MRRLLAALLLLAFPAAAGADPGVTVSDAWSRATPIAGMSAVGYATIRNAGAVADRLTGIDCPVARSAMLHGTEQRDGIVRMRMLDGLDIPPGQAVTLAPGGTHLMLSGAERLTPGSTFTCTLTFRGAGRVSAVFAVQAAGAMQPTHRH